MRRWAVFVGLVAGCGPASDAPSDLGRVDDTTTVSWIQSFGWSWNAFNHRLSALHAVATDEGVEAGVVGGASTTAHVFDDGDSCVNADTCWELPTLDTTLFSATRGTASSETVQLTHTSVVVVATPAGVSQTITVQLPRAVSPADHVAVWIGGLTLRSDVDTASAPASCYDPRHGWLPVRLELAVGSNSTAYEGSTVDVAVWAAFEAGDSLESQRVCYDALRAAGTLRVTLDLVVAVGDLTARPVLVTQGGEWSDGRAEQPLDEVGGLDASLDPTAMVGWSSVVLRFGRTADAGRGAYLRGLALVADPDQGQAYGYATNTSFTALSGFAYGFEGTVVEVTADVETSRETYGLDAMPAELDPVTFEPVWSALERGP